MVIVGKAIAAVVLSLLNWLLFVRSLELTDNCLESAHCRFTTPQGHAIDFGHGVQDHAAMFHSFAKVKLKTLILNIAQLTGQGGGGGNHKGDDGEVFHFRCGKFDRIDNELTGAPVFIVLFY